MDFEQGVALKASLGGSSECRASNGSWLAENAGDERSRRFIIKSAFRH